MNELCSNYDVTCNTNRWAMVVFHSVLHLHGTNTLIACKENNKCKVSQSNPYGVLGLEFLRHRLQQRKSKRRELGKTLVEHIDELTGEQAGAASQRPSATTGKAKRCPLCPTTWTGKQNINAICGSNTCLCNMHLCEDCLGCDS